MNRKAFTLVELAIVLMVVGLLVGGSFKVIKLMRERNKVTEAKDAVKAAKDATIGFAMEWVDLPTPTEFTNDLSPSKGVSEGDIFYFTDPQLANGADVCSFPSTNLNVTIFNSGILTRTVNNVAFVIAARSANNNMQTAVAGNSPYIIRIDDPSATVDRNNSDFLRASDEYDDIVKWVTLPELHNLVNCLDHKLVITNDNALPRDINHTAYVGANIFADGGFPFADSDGDGKDDYEWCMESTSGAWPNSYTCGSATFTSQTDCTLSSSTYNQCTSPTIVGTTGPAGTYNFNMYLRDSRRTIKKSFTITIDGSY